MLTHFTGQGKYYMEFLNCRRIFVSCQQLAEVFPSSFSQKEKSHPQVAFKEWYTKFPNPEKCFLLSAKAPFLFNYMNSICPPSKR